jgi:hypothetical protein
MTNDMKFRLARVAVTNGITRDAFIAARTGHDESRQTRDASECLEVCQSWAAAFDEALSEIQDQAAICTPMSTN